MANVTCSDPLHATRSAQPGWQTVLGVVASGTIDGMVCVACAAARTTASVDTADNRTVLAVAQGGAAVVTVVRKYASGEVVASIMKAGDLGNWPARTDIVPGTAQTKIQMFRSLGAEIRDWLLTL